MDPMDAFLAEIAPQRLKPVAWQILLLLIGRRKVEAFTDVRVLDRSDDARWRACRDLVNRGYIERVTPTDAWLWRISDKLRARLDGPQAVVRAAPEQAPASFSADAPPVKPPPVQSFSPPPPPPKYTPPAFNTVSQPAQQAAPSPFPFLNRPREMQLQALALWRRSGLRQDLLAIAARRVDASSYVHLDLEKALELAERWALRLV